MTILFRFIFLLTEANICCPPLLDYKYTVFYSNRLKKLLQLIQNLKSLKLKFYNELDLCIDLRTFYFFDSRTFYFFNCPNSDTTLKYKQKL